jgi:hypothetical protein
MIRRMVGVKSTTQRMEKLRKVIGLMGNYNKIENNLSN